MALNIEERNNQTVLPSGCLSNLSPNVKSWLHLLLPQPVCFFVPSQLVSSLVEPPPLVQIPPLPPAARIRFAIKSLGNDIWIYYYTVRACKE